MSFDPIADLMNGLNTTADGTRDRSRPCPGLGIYLLESFGPKNTEKGVIITASLRVAKPAEGSTKKPGDVVELAWFISKGAKEGGENEKARARDFVNALIGAPKGSPAGENSLKLSQPTQPGTGIAIGINTRVTTYTRKDQTKGTGFEYAYEHIPGQSGEQITANRAALASLATAQTYQAPAPVAPPVAPVAPPMMQVAAPVAPPAAAPPAGSPLAFLFK